MRRADDSKGSCPAPALQRARPALPASPAHTPGTAGQWGQIIVAAALMLSQGTPRICPSRNTPVDGAKARIGFRRRRGVTRLCRRDCVSCLFRARAAFPAPMPADQATAAPKRRSMRRFGEYAFLSYLRYVVNNVVATWSPRSEECAKKSELENRICARVSKNGAADASQPSFCKLQKIRNPEILGHTLGGPGSHEQGVDRPAPRRRARTQSEAPPSLDSLDNPVFAVAARAATGTGDLGCLCNLAHGRQP